MNEILYVQHECGCREVSNQNIILIVPYIGVAEQMIKIYTLTREKIPNEPRKKGKN